MKFEAKYDKSSKKWSLVNTVNGVLTEHDSLSDVKKVFNGILGEKELWKYGRKILPKKPYDTKTYTLHKLTINRWGLTQGSEKNLIKQTFKSASGAYNYVKFKGKDTKLVFKNKIVTPELLTSLDKVSFFNKVKSSYPDVKSINVKKQSTIVVLVDGRKGVSRLHSDDTYDEQLGFFYAYNKAKMKTPTKENIKMAEENLMNEIKNKLGYLTKEDLSFTKLW